jgi:tetratricopeptide (TPR) repeat protein
MALYDAFISYSHAKDKPIAARLQSTIQKLGKPWYRRRALRLFRDDTSLSATPHLWPMIEQTLGQARYFLLLASPEAAASKWVNKEAIHWIEHNSIDTVLIALTHGELFWDEAGGDFAPRANHPLPLALAKRFPHEPKWVDLRPYREGADKRDAKFTELAADFAAAIHGTPKEDLLSQEVRQQRVALTLAWSAAASLTVLVALATWQWRTADSAKRAAQTAEQLAKGTADSLVINVAQGLRQVEGMRAESVRKILETAKGTFDKLAAASPGDLGLQGSRAAMLNEFGETYHALGDLNSALSAYLDSVAIGERLTRLDATNTTWQRDLAVAHVGIGDTQKSEGNLADALTSYRTALASFERCPRRPPTIPDGSVISRSSPARSAASWRRRESARTRSRPIVKARRSSTAWPSPIRPTADGSAICRWLTPNSATR